MCLCVWVAFDRQISFAQARPLGGVPRIVKRTFVLGAFLGCVPRGTEELHWRRGSRTSNESGPRITRGNPCCVCVCVWFKWNPDIRETRPSPSSSYFSLFFFCTLLRLGFVCALAPNIMCRKMNIPSLACFVPYRFPSFAGIDSNNKDA